MKARHRRFTLIAIAFILLGIGAWLILSAFKKNMVFFYTPSQVLAGEAPRGKNFRMGGMVEANSLQRLADGQTINFVVTDNAKKISVRYKGILPDLFKQGKGVVVQGKLGTDQVMIADEVLAKHDENYMPPEAAYALKRGDEANQKYTLKEPDAIAGKKDTK
ncbi:cytochrome c maturation protein CcmE [Undibacterium sp. Ji22W]|uniref:cytochrome c maturation protein CcmE n=1 Tax=Undibacterium sp. Ji22W TaxID=3413038 RepID=UPI003BF2044D